jgi:hypothetical protein
MKTVKSKIYKLIAWFYHIKARNLIIGVYDGNIDPDEYGEKLQYYINKVTYWIDKRRAMCH